MLVEKKNQIKPLFSCKFLKSMHNSFHHMYFQKLKTLVRKGAFDAVSQAPQTHLPQPRPVATAPVPTPWKPAEDQA